MNRIIIGASRIALILGMAGATPSFAQDSQAAQEGGIEEIVVTAQKRVERMQDVPISIGAISAAQAGAKGINDTASIQAAIPGLVINRTANEGNIFVRGVGTNLFGPASEQTVAVYVDNVYYASPEANLFTFNNIERIEVLKGPQGTLFGRNTTGGVVHIITREPSDQLRAEASLGYANYQALSASAYLGGPLSETVSADLAANYADQGKGWGRNLFTGRDNGIMADGNYAVRSKLKFIPSDATTIHLALDYSHALSRYSYQLAKGVTGADGASTYAGEYNALTGLRDLERLNTGGGSLQVEQAIGDLKLVSITSYRWSNVRYLLDQDDTPAVIADLSLPSKAHNWSQEVQLHGASSAPFKWVLGGFFFDAVAAYTPADVNYGVVLIADRQKTRSFAGFGQASTEIFPDTNLTGGLRYTYERQKLIVDSFAVGGAVIPLPNDRQSFRKLTWRAALDHHFNADALAYISYNRGFKSGGFNLLAPNTAPFRPEVLDAYEAGFKTEWFDRRLRFNLALFRYDYKDIQVTIPQLGGIVTLNAARARIKGLEATIQTRPVSKLNLDASIALLDGKYRSYPNALFIGPNGESTDASGNPLTIDARGNRTIATPKLTANIGGDYGIDTSVGEFRVAMNAAYNDGYFFYADNRLTQPSYWLVNGSITWTLPGGRFDAQLWAKNLTDATYYVGRSEQAGLGDAQRQAAPRTYGVTLTARF
ncbi:TonB-dependent receptor [Sphingomonas sp. Root710]|uniref:TonB-dependent receptor n=1 Tax=Sphingomonas sp. Root710 TaxID=1736594 RepID=UPI00138F5E6C|nr:TonB-dependent receptor [Sphingomonas sp. Root710]